MLTIQPNLVSSYSKVPAFGRTIDDEYIDYTEVLDNENEDSFELAEDNSDEKFNIDDEREELAKDLDLWKQTKHNIDSIAKTTEAVPGVKTGMKVFSGLISVAIGWGGLRWGATGTLEAFSKLAESRLGKAVSGYGEAGIKQLGKAKRAITGSGIYNTVETKASKMKEDFIGTSFGTKLKNWKDAITSNSLYIKTVNAKNSTVGYVKKLNPKRIFVETMGLAGGGTAAINTLGGKSVDGVKQNVEVDKDGNYTVNGRYLEHKGDYSNAA